MAYTPTEWKDHIVQHPNRFRVIDNGDGTVDILDEHGEILQQGTPVDASRLNKMEKGIKEAHDLIDAHLNDFILNTRGNKIYHVEVVSSSVSETPDAGRIIFDTSRGKFFGGNGTGWV